jgi:hypothetical protein
MSGTFFGIQIAIQSPPGEPWREGLVELLRGNMQDQSIFEKRVLYSRLAQHLAAARPRWTLGTWDYITGAGGEVEFDSWVSGLEACADEPVTDRAGDHVVVSVALLVEPGSRSESVLGERCDLPESEWHTRAAFNRLIDSLRMLAFPGVLADGVYLVPGDAAAGVPLDELRGEGWDYLKPLT